MYNDYPIECLDLSVRTFNYCKRAHLWSIGDLENTHSKGYFYMQHLLYVEMSKIVHYPNRPTPVFSVFQYNEIAEKIAAFR